MSDVVIRAEGLGKKYLIGHQNERPGQTTFREWMVGAVGGIGRSAAKMARGDQLIAGDEVEEFWALKDVSFEIKRGDVVGIIGRNGAGKSTLLKILSRITEPTEGRVTIHGRVASLLEVGTGFHPELTGRENIFLNGAILGMSRAEIRRKLDEIVDFAGIEKFLDTPVKRYSSGMYVRLAFAVAAHLEPEILVVDEVLAVGDAEFQKKCLGKMRDVAGNGRTVLFVSHNISALSSLCRYSLLLNRGALVLSATTQKAIATYLLIASARDSSPLLNLVDGRLEILLEPQSIEHNHGEANFSLEFNGYGKLQASEAALIISSAGGVRLCTIDLRKSGVPIWLESGACFSLTVKNLNFCSGLYDMTLWISGGDINANIPLGLYEIVSKEDPGNTLSLYRNEVNGPVMLCGSVTRIK